VIIGVSQSVTVTVKLQGDWLREQSVAVQFTVVSPTLKDESGGGWQTIVIGPAQ
jgi:hypothetical protein